MWEIWDKISNINGVSTKDFMNHHNHLDMDDTIYIKIVDNRVVQVESKRILSNIHGIDIALSDDDFISAYVEKLSMPQEPMEIDFNVLDN